MLSDEATFQYKCTDYYDPEHEGGIAWNDPTVDVKWPLEGIEEVILSDKDKDRQTIQEFIQKGNPFRL